MNIVYNNLHLHHMHFFSTPAHVPVFIVFASLCLVCHNNTDEMHLSLQARRGTEVHGPSLDLKCQKSFPVPGGWGVAKCSAPIWFLSFQSPSQAAAGPGLEVSSTGFSSHELWPNSFLLPTILDFVDGSWRQCGSSEEVLVQSHIYCFSY